MKTRIKKTRKIKLRYYIVLAAIFILGSTAFGVIVHRINQNKEIAEITIIANKYKKYLGEQNFSEFTNLFSEESFISNKTSKEDVTNRYKAIFENIGTKKISIKNFVLAKENKNLYNIFYTLKVETSVGHINTEKYHVNVIKKNNNYILKWSPDLIFPDMIDNDTIQMVTDNVERGEILDRNGKKIAENHNYQQLGINPSKIGEGVEKEKYIQEISQEFNIPLETIQTKLNQSWAKGDIFVPIKVLEKTISQADIRNFPKGLIIGNINMRHYHLKEAAAHLLGYVSKVSAEDIKENHNLSENDYIGRSGLEATFDKKLRGKNGVSINIVDSEGNIKKRLLNIEKVDPINLQLSIDSDAQQIAFNSLENKPGSILISSPQNGDLLVATSSPSYNPNKMVLGITEEEYREYEQDKNFPFISRFANRYAPGSTFKTITAAIGLDSGHINIDEERKINGLKWQKDDSWGGFLTTRVKDIPSVNLKKALVYSDNIFFAQKSLEMGETKLRDGLNEFIFGEKLTLPIYMEPASISNDDRFPNDILLADTSYGQGELLISPIGQLAMYSVFMNDGNLIYPQIVKDQKIISKKEVISASSADIVLNDLIDVVSSPEGYAHNLYKENFTLAAKTGTAEIKEKQDTLGKENSFLLFFDVNNKNFMGLIMSENSRENGSATEKSEQIVNYLQNKY